MKGIFTQHRKQIKLFFRRVFLSLLALIVTVSQLPLTALALWDGQGNTGGDTSAIPVAGGFSLPYDGPENIIGYRFTVYATVDSGGERTAEKAGHSSDVHFKSVYGWDTVYHSASWGKRDHVDHNRFYMENGGGYFLGLTSNLSTTHYVYQFSDIASKFTLEDYPCLTKQK